MPPSLLCRAAPESSWADSCNATERFVRMSALVVVLAALVVTVAPGYVLARSAYPHLSPLTAAAASVAVSAGLLHSSALWLSVLQVHVAWSGAVAAILGLIAVLAARRRKWRGIEEWRSLWRWDLVASACGSVLILALWLIGTDGLHAVPPHDDGYHHGYWVARIGATGSISQSLLNTIDPISSTQVLAFYPMATHLEAALVRWTTGADAALSFNAVTLVGTALMLPVGMLVLTRRLFPERTWAGPTGAVLAATAPTLAFSVSWSGMFPQMLGMAALPGAALLADDFLRRPQVRTFLVSTLALAGLVGIHTSAAAFCVIVVLVLSLVRGHRLSWSARVTGGCVWVGAALMVSIPALLSMVGGWREREATESVAIMGVPKAVGSVAVLWDFLAGGAPLAFAVLAWGGFLLAVRRRRLPAWSGLVLCLSLAFLLTLVWRSRPVLLLTSPWYSNPGRMSTLLTFAMVPLAAYIAVDEQFHQKAARWGIRPTFMVKVLLACAVFGGCLSGSVHIQQNYRDYSLIGSQDSRAFRWLAVHSRSGERVLNGRADGSQWMYPVANVVPLSWVKLAAPGPEVRERDWLTANAAKGWSDPRVAADLQSLHVRYAYVGNDFFPETENVLDGDALARSRYWRLAYSSGGVRVFELLPASSGHTSMDAS